MRESEAKTMFWAWGLAMHKSRRTVITVWLLLFLGLSYFATQTQGLLKDNGFTPQGAESEQGLALLEHELGATGSSFQVVFESDSLDMTAEPQKQAIMESLSRLQASPDIGPIEWLEESRIDDNRHVAAVQVPILLPTDEALDRYPDIRELIVAPEGMDAYVTGGTPVLYDMQEASRKDIVKAELIGIPIAMIVLLLIFGTVPAAVLPLIVGLVSVTVTLGIVYFVAGHMSLSNFLPNIVTMLGLAVGIDYALFMVSRFREELGRRETIAEAVAMTSQTAGKSIFFSGAAVLIGLLGMLFIPLNFFQSLCLGGVLVVSVSVLVANTLLLALMGVFGDKLNRWHVLPKAWRSRKDGRAWRTIAKFVMRRPIALTIVVGAVLVAAMLPLAGMQMGIPNAEVLPPSYESRYGADLLYQAFDRRELEPMQVVVESEQPYWDGRTLEALRGVQAEIGKQEGVESVFSFADLVPEGLTGEQTAAWLRNPDVQASFAESGAAKDRFFVIQVVSAYEPYDSANDDLIERIRGIEAEGLSMKVTGSEAYRSDIIRQIEDGIPWVLAFVMGVTYIILLIAFRSVVLPIKAVLMNVLSLGASLGVVVQVFQHGHFAELLQVTSIGNVNATLPVLIFCVVFGISMDYEVFLISRMMEEYEATGDNEHSTAEGLMKTGSLITSAAAILIVVVGTFIFTDIEIMKALGLGLSLAVLLDASVVRIGLVPALMKLLGKANWWAPRWLNPIRPINASQATKP